MDFGIAGVAAITVICYFENIWVGRSEKMTKKAETDYTIKVNGMPNYANIPKAVLEPIAKKFLENILKEQQKKET